jgi:hypothetical protein
MFQQLVHILGKSPTEESCSKRVLGRKYKVISSASEPLQLRHIMLIYVQEDNEHQKIYQTYRIMSLKFKKTCNSLEPYFKSNLSYKTSGKQLQFVNFVNYMRRITWTISISDHWRFYSSRQFCFIRISQCFLDILWSNSKIKLIYFDGFNIHKLSEYRNLTEHQFALAQEK